MKTRSIQLFFATIFLALSMVSFDLFSPPPEGAIGPYLNGVFPASTPGEGGSWELEDLLPGTNIPSPVRIIPFTGSTDLLVLSKQGQVWRVSSEQSTKELVLDITDRSFKLGEGGTVGVALHPDFWEADQPDKQLLFVYYRTKPEPDKWSELGFNRLSKFKWDEVSGTFDADSEEVLLQQYDRVTWHNGGAMFFGPDGFLYLSIGDEGVPEYQEASTQRIDGGFFSGVLRIDVDNDPTRSHPIRRQPQFNEAPPEGWGETFSKGYSIPDDNPWLNPEGSVLEEFYAIGLRSPYTMHYDGESGLIWVADVGQSQSEEISLIAKGDNLQWPYLEGTFRNGDREKPDNLIGQEKGIYFEYDRSLGACVIGGGLYRGTLFPELYEKYIFGDCVSNRLMALTNTGSQSEPELETLISNIGNQGLDMPPGPVMTGVFSLPNGEVLVSVISFESGDGKIFRLKRKTTVPDPPARLSELGVFTDLETLTPVQGLIPYQVNAPLWSDRATKKRWIALPNDGTFDRPEEQIVFRKDGEWNFPEGTVFVKHFELPTSMEGSGEPVRLETRFFVIGENQQSYGLTYKWNSEGTEAFLLGGGSSKDIDIYEGGSLAFTQTWDFPSRDQCMSCHNANANFVLGVKTHQLNGEQYYPSTGQTVNQLEYLNQLGAFTKDIGPAGQYLRARRIDDETADLELRVRSYLDANCAACHRPGGVGNLSVDLRLTKPLPLQGMINVKVASHSSRPGSLIVQPGDHQASELWRRDASMNENRMPPIARNMADEVYLDALAEWIDNLSEDDWRFDQNLIFPNPSQGAVDVRIREDWAPPFQIDLFNAAGQLVQQEMTDSRTIFLDLSTQPKGIYFLNLSAGTERYVERLIVF